MSKRIVTLCVLAVLMVSLVIGFGPVAAAQDKVEYTPLHYLEESEIVGQIQQRLRDLDYFDEGERYTPGKLDEVTINALRRFYDVNGMNWDDEISPVAQKIILETSAKPRPIETETPSPTPDEQATPFPEVHPGEWNIDVVQPIQSTLKNKGYFSETEGSFTPGFMDSPTIDAIARFCEVNRIAFNPDDGLTLPLYNIIIDKDAPTYAPPTSTPFSLIAYNTQSDEIRTIQTRLKELGYFRDYGDPSWGWYGEKTQSAVRRFCKVNNIPESEYGMDLIFYEKLMGESALPNPVDRKDYIRGETDETVIALQDRLFNLGYYKQGQRTNIYDPDMDAALNLFADANQIGYDGITLTVALQDAVMNEKALPYSPERDKTLVAEKEKQGLSGNVHFLGIEMPLFVMILLIVVILAGLAFLIIRVFFGQDKSSGQTGGTDYFAGASSGSGGRELNLDIRFQGSSRTVTVNMDKPLRIGRTERTLPLESDSDISRQHCQMSFRGDALILRDYSTNGTEVNHQIYHNCECVIHNGDTIKIGRHEITVRF